jgi:hypothetical protein
MENFRLETLRIVGSFLQGHINFTEYVAAVDASLASAMPRLKDGELPQLRGLILGTNQIVMEEMLRRRLAADQLVPDDEPEVSTQLARGSHCLRSIRSIVGR